jgi:hypothetical protein
MLFREQVLLRRLQVPATQCNAVVLQQMAGVLYFDCKGGVCYPRLAEFTFFPAWRGASL